MTVYLDNDFEHEFELTRKNTATGAIEAAAGLSSLTAHFSATDGGATINAAISVSLAERASTPGTYFGINQGDDLRTYLETYIGQTVWEVAGDGTNVYVSEPHVVYGTRRPER